MGIKIGVSVRESFRTYIARDFVIIDSDDSEETKGMSMDELMEYITENYQEDNNLLNEEEKNQYNTLSEKLFEQEETREKMTEHDSWLAFRDEETGDIKEKYPEW